MISSLPVLLSYCLALLGTCAAAPGATTADSIDFDRKGCRTIKKTLVVTWELANPNGNTRMVIHVNKQFPAPDLFFNEDDHVEITVKNLMPTNTTIHWHGLLMQGTPWSDGTPGLSQTPIEPGESFIYRFKAAPAGTYWYHAHSRMALMDGLYGALHIKPKPGTPTPWSMISKDKKDLAAIEAAAADPTLVTISDWTNVTSVDYLQVQIDSGLNIFCTDSILINGKGAVYCPPLKEIEALIPPDFNELLLPKGVNDKGCLPFVQSTQDDFWKTANYSAIPFGMQEGCVAANNTKDPMSIIKVDPADKWVSVNVVMASTLRVSTFSIDNHYMWIYEMDGAYIEPVKSQAMVMYPGQRIAAMIKLNQTPSDYTIRVAGYPGTGVMAGFAVFSYKGGKPMKNYTLGYEVPSKQSAGWIDYGGVNRTADFHQFDGFFDLAPPYPPKVPAMPKPSDPLHYIPMARFGAAWQWSMNSQSLMPVDGESYAPLLYNKSYPGALRPDLVIRTKNNTWVDLILQAGAPPGPVEINHVIHKHASRFWVIGQGAGVWNYSSVAEGMKVEPQSFNLVNPNYRDSTVTPFYVGWVAIRYLVDNPGPWLLHCHVETHLAGGMAMVLLDGIDTWPTIPPEYAIHQHGFPVKGHVYDNW
ncbi:laccase-1 [Rhexocercosporidium sp. MPI-PUGE-AT-0058]|nr:laccase-1 [Rhexocercosporidium sp. MPI-PUGE-AT-0058]